MARSRSAWVAACWVAVACLTLLLTVPGRAAERRVALVIGNAAYRNLPPLGNPANDARLVGETLKSLGFELVGGAPQIDLDKAGFDRAVRQFGEQLQGADVGLFYYAGHGLQVQGTNWLVPVEANPTAQRDLDFQMEDADLVLKQMQFAKTRLNLMILDACRNNPFRGAGLRAATGGLAEMRAPEGTLIAYSTQPGNVANDGAGANSPFSEALARTIRQPGLDVFRVFNAIGLTVKRQTGGEQQPWMSSSPIDGDFYFSGVGRDGAPAVVADPDLVFWQSIGNASDPAPYRAYLQQFPNGRFAELARARSRGNDAPPAPPPSGSFAGGLLAFLQPTRPQAARVVQDRQTLLFNASVESLRWLRGMVLRSYASYAGQFDPERGPTGKERSVSFWWQFDSRAAPSLDVLRGVLAGQAPDAALPFAEPEEPPFGIRPPDPPAIAAGNDVDTLQVLAQRYVDAADKMIAAGAPADAYYRSDDYRDDDMAKGRVMHRGLIAAYREFLPAAEALQAFLWRLEPAARQAFLAGLSPERQRIETARLETIRRAREVVQFYSASVRDGRGKARPADAPGMAMRIDAVTQSYAEFDLIRTKPVDGGIDDSVVFNSSYRSFLDTAKDVWRAQRDRSESYGFAEKQSSLVHSFNSMVFSAAR